MGRSIATFRVDPSVKRRLEEAARRAGLSVSAYLEAMLLRALEEGSRDHTQAVAEEFREEMRGQFEAVLGEARGLRRDLAVSVRALLQTVGERDPIPAEDIERWMTKHLGVPLGTSSQKPSTSRTLDRT